jgi:hypothetical protein
MRNRSLYWRAAASWSRVRSLAVVLRHLFCGFVLALLCARCAYAQYQLGVSKHIGFHQFTVGTASGTNIRC